jgi:hypothetical protein
MLAPLSCPSAARPAQDTGFALMRLPSFPGSWPPSLKMMIRPALMMRALQLPQSLQHLQHHLALQCHSTATRLLYLHPLTAQYLLHLQDWDSQPLDLSHPGALAESLSHLTALLLPTYERHSDAHHCPALLLMQLSHSRHSQSCRPSRLWSLTLGQTH